jgi:hypothetical protein
MTMTERTKRISLLLVAGSLLFLACATTAPFPPTGGTGGTGGQGIPTCANCKITMGTFSSTAQGTFTSYPRTYSSAKIQLTYGASTPAPHTMSVPFLNVPFTKQVVVGKNPLPSKAEVLLCYTWGTQTPCHRQPLTVNVGP